MTDFKMGLIRPASRQGSRVDFAGFRPFPSDWWSDRTIHNPYEADAIYLDLDYLDCNKDFAEISETKSFQDNAHKCFCYSMHDNPTFAYKPWSNDVTKFIAQPLVQNGANIIPVPLQMRHFERELIKDTKFIEQCRNRKKEYDYIFVGQVKYANRDWLYPENIKPRLLTGSSYVFRETEPIWNIKTVEDRVNLVKDFCWELAGARFAFCPRGIGSSSFRLFQSLMVGTVPILTGMIEYPMKEVVNWDRIALYIPPTRPLTDYEGRREDGIKAWDNYFHMTKTDEYLFEKYLEKK